MNIIAELNYHNIYISGSTFKSWAPGDNKSKKNFLQICPSQTSLSAVGTTTGGESQNLSNNCGVPNSRP